MGALEGKTEDVECRKQDVHRDERKMFPAVSIAKGGIISFGTIAETPDLGLAFPALSPVGGEGGWRWLPALCCVPEVNLAVIRLAAVTDLLQNRK